jgi:hypothetical protein
MHSYPRHYVKMHGQLHASATLPAGEKSLIPIGGKLSGIQSRSGRDGRENKSLPLPRIESRPFSS